MKKHFIILFICIFIANVGTLTGAKDTTAKVNPIKVGAYGVLCIPIGEFSSQAHIGYGMVGSVDYRINQNQFITAFIGYIHFPTKDDSRYYSNIPLFHELQL